MNNDNNYEKFLRRLNQYRIRLNMTQKETSSGLGIDQSQYSKMELGKTIISYKVLVLFMEMGWDVDYLVTGKKFVRGSSKLRALIAQREKKDRQEILSIVAWLLEQGVEKSVPENVKKQTSQTYLCALESV